MDRIKALDGWRGLSILFVLVGHFAIWRYSFLPLPDTANWSAVHLAHIGVSIFFCISGYLIHSLALREIARTRTFSPLKFYVRRIFRIVPAFALYVAAVVALGESGVYSMAASDALPALAFSCNFVECPALLTHTWSLSVEEQFYLLFPTVVMLSQRGRVVFFIGFIGAMAGLLLWDFRAHTAASHWILGHAKPFTFIVAGMAWAEIRPHLAIEPVSHASRAAVPVYMLALALSVVMHGDLTPGSTASYAVVIWDMFILPVATGFVLMLTQDIGQGILASKSLRFVGKVSFSLYLWQQLFAAHPDLLHTQSMLFWPVFLFPVAVASYYFVEKPFIRIGRRLLEPNDVGMTAEQVGIESTHRRRSSMDRTSAS